MVKKTNDPISPDPVIQISSATNKPTACTMTYSVNGWTITPTQSGEPYLMNLDGETGYATVTVVNSNTSFDADQAEAYQSSDLSNNQTAFDIYTPSTASNNEFSFRLVDTSELNDVQTGIIPTTRYRIKNVHSGYYLQATSASGDSLVQNAYPTSASSQPKFQWGFIQISENLYRVFNIYYGAMVDAKSNDNPPSNGTKVQTYSWKTSSIGNQEWTWSATNKTFASSYSSTMVWMISGSSKSANASVVLETYSSGSTAQQWTLEPIE